MHSGDIFSDLPVGQVAQQSILPATLIDRGDAVTVAISKGPDVVTMPSLSGLNYATVQAALTAAGLQVGTVTGNTAGFLYGINVAGAPVTVGQQLPRGTAIDLSYY